MRAMIDPHTPGPWAVFGDEPHDFPGIEADHTFSIVIVRPYGDNDDAGVRGKTQEEAWANGRLIAAAPELLAALQETVASIRGRGPRDGKLLARADAAIAKATGAK